MSSTELLLIVNSILLGLISILFFVVGYFLRDLHRDFKRMIERVNKLSGDISTHSNLFDNLGKMFQRQIDNLRERINKLEKENKN